MKSKKIAQMNLFTKEKQIHRQTMVTKMEMCWSLSHVRLLRPHGL